MRRILWPMLAGILLLWAGWVSAEYPTDGTPHSEAVSRDAGLSEGVRTLEDWYAMGGPVMHLLALCSVLVVGISLERAWRLQRGSVLPRRVVAAAASASHDGDLGDLKSVCTAKDSVLSRVLMAGMGATEPVERVAELGRSEAQRLRRNLPLLAALANIATMLGLLGTVLGMIEAFELIAGAGTGDAKIVASGIFRALVTTAAGLGIGIAALTLHALFSRRADEFTHELEDIVGRVWGNPPDPSGESERPAVRAVN